MLVRDQFLDALGGSRIPSERKIFGSSETARITGQGASEFAGRLRQRGRPSTARQTATGAAVSSRRWPPGIRALQINHPRAFRDGEAVRHIDSTLATEMINFSAGKPAEAP
jgi:hypothetical protein